MPNIELVIVIYYNVFKFHVPRSNSFQVIIQKHTHTHTHMDAHKDSNEYSIVVFCKNATIIIGFIR